MSTPLDTGLRDKIMFVYSCYFKQAFQTRPQIRRYGMNFDCRRRRWGLVQEHCHKIGRSHGIRAAGNDTNPDVPAAQTPWRFCNWKPQTTMFNRTIIAKFHDCSSAIAKTWLRSPTLGCCHAKMSEICRKYIAQRFVYPHPIIPTKHNDQQFSYYISPGKMMRNEVNWLGQFWSLSYLSNRGHFGHFSRLPRMPKMQLIGVGSQHLEANGPAGSLWIGYWLVVWNMFFIGYRPTTMGIWWLYWFVVWNRIFFHILGIIIPTDSTE